MNRGGWLCLAILGCGSPQSSVPPPRAETAFVETSNLPPAKTAQTSEPAPKSNLEAQRDAYIKACENAPGMEPYCHCGWDVFAHNVTEDEMNGLSRARLDEVTKLTVNACGSKVPESVVQKNFVNRCSEGDSTVTSYCECFWSELRNQFSTAELATADVVKRPDFIAARWSIARGVCGPKLPEASVRKAFVAACSKNDPAKEKFCTCGWKEVRAALSPAEIRMEDAVDTDQFKKAMARLPKVCDRFRPTP